MSVLHMTIESETLAHVAAPNRFKDFWRHGSQLSAVKLARNVSPIQPLCTASGSRVASSTRQNHA
jgi:hypothetical protein